MKWKTNRQVLPVHHDEPPSLSRQIKFLDPNQAVDNGWRDTVQRLWLRFKMRAFSTSTGSPSDGLGRGTATTSDSSMALRMRPDDAEDAADWIVDEVVVDGGDPEHHSGSEKGTSTGTRRTDSATSIHADVHGHAQQRESSYYHPSLTAWLRYRAYPLVKTFFNPRFDEPEKESEYKALNWWSAKPFAFWASIFLVCNWVLYLGLNLQSTRESLYAQICYYGGLTLLTAPLPFFVAYNMPKHQDVFFQIWFCAAVWFCAYSEVIQIKQCGFFRRKEADPDNCHGKDFLAMSYYSTGLPAIMMFIISKRLYNAIAQVIYFILLIALIIPDQDIYARNVINFIVFSIFLQALHFSIEMTNRRIFVMNYQLKLAYQGQDKARIKETKANNAKKRFASYIFHEVRVPLNTATLAFQNLQTENVFKNIPYQQVEVEALEASLSMMQQVLNDALDFHKMDAGRFDSHPRPFQLHRVINSVLRPIDVSAQAQNLKLIINLDKNIDLVPSPVDSSDGLWVVGDELRLRQALTNLTSNAVKFSFEGGEVAVTTKLINILPAIKPERRGSEKESHGEKRIVRLGSDENVRPRSLVFRLEVKDSGPGVKPSDMVEGGLFQPFVQTNVGISSGKGTGLGLAIVRQIVTRSGGRLGVRSQRGQGAVFWIEFTYPLATASDIESAQQNSVAALTPSSSQLSYQTHSTLANPESLVSASEGTAAESPDPQKEIEGMLQLPNPEPVVPAAAPEELLVLVVDDDPLTRTLMKRMLTKLGCKVDTADDGQQFLDLVTQLDAPQYDMICLDNYMPRLTGEQAIGELRALGRKDLVIGCTGNALSEDQSSYLKAGADRVLTKPIMLKDLKSALDLACSRKVRQ